MNWLIWKQHRKMFVILIAILALYTALVVPTGLHFWHTYQHAKATCGQTNTCANLSGELLQSGWDSNLNPSQPGGGVNLVVLLILALPFLLGMFVGVPLIAREYNDNTNLLIWTRSISRRKWLTTKLAWTLIATAVFAGIFVALTTWWSKTGNTLYVNRFDTVKFDLQGIAPIAYAIFAVSLGIALGTWLKRIMFAIGLTLAIFLAAQILIGSFLRPHYMTPWAYNAPVVQQANADANASGDPLSAQAPPNSGASWVVSGSLVSKTGQSISWSNPPQKCIVTHPDNGGNAPSGSHSSAVGVAPSKDGAVRDAILSRNGGPAVDLDCLGTIGYHWNTEYQPAYRYWDFQRIEAALYLGLTLIPIGATYWLVLKRDA
jgi:ABC-type transport system involved in multi-copper enzyme maturation permease subunit